MTSEASSVKLVNVTENAEKMIMRCARVSSKNQFSDDPKILKFCIEKGHWSVFEMANMCVEIETSRMISAQIIRHRSCNFLEMSQRFKEIEGDQFIINEARFSNPAITEENKKEAAEWFEKMQKEHYKQTFDLYKQALNKGISRECARAILPLSTQTKIYMNATIRSWIHYLQARLADDSQKEHREIAQKIAAIFKQQMPTISKALNDFNL
jgi:thymidylate synthase (FAD)